MWGSMRRKWIKWLVGAKTGEQVIILSANSLNRPGAIPVAWAGHRVYSGDGVEECETDTLWLTVYPTIVAMLMFSVRTGPNVQITILIIYKSFFVWLEGVHVNTVSDLVHELSAQHVFMCSVCAWLSLKWFTCLLTSGFRHQGAAQHDMLLKWTV